MPCPPSRAPTSCSHHLATAGVAAANCSHLHLSPEPGLWLKDTWEVILPHRVTLTCDQLIWRKNSSAPLASERDPLVLQLMPHSSRWDQAEAGVLLKPHLCPESAPALSCCPHSLTGFSCEYALSHLHKHPHFRLCF